MKMKIKSRSDEYALKINLVKKAQCDNTVNCLIDGYTCCIVSFRLLISAFQ